MSQGYTTRFPATKRERWTMFYGKRGHLSGIQMHVILKHYPREIVN